MSFNRLPDELVAQMATHLDYKDVVNLCQTQKRMNNILKRFKLDKPKIAELRVRLNWGGKIRAICRAKEKEDGPIHRIQLRNPDAEIIAIALECIAKFRSIEMLEIWESSINENEDDVFLLNNMFVEKLAETKVKIRKFELYNGKVDFSCDKFIAFCKKFKKVLFDNITISPTLICDQTICEIVSTTIIDFEVGNLEAVDLSDKTLQAIANGKSASPLRFHAATETKFTIAGIREFVENIINKTWEYTSWALGKLNNQLDDAMNWKNYVDQHPELTYGVDVVEFPNGTMNVEVISKSGNFFLGFRV